MFLASDAFIESAVKTIKVCTYEATVHPHNFNCIDWDIYKDGVT